MGMLVVLAVLAAIRLLSEVKIHLPRRGSKKGLSMISTTTTGTNSRRNFLQYLLETIWTVGAGALVAHWFPELVNARRRAASTLISGLAALRSIRYQLRSALPKGA